MNEQTSFIEPPQILWDNAWAEKESGSLKLHVLFKCPS